jgi:hypothetical protein
LKAAKDRATKKQKKKIVTQEPTQEAAQAKKDKEKRKTDLGKEAMKRQRGDHEEAGKEESATLDSRKKTLSKKTAGKKVTTKKATRPRQVPIPQGRRKVPTAGDESGCKHHGLRELDI